MNNAVEIFLFFACELRWKKSIALKILTCVAVLYIAKWAILRMGNKLRFMKEIKMLPEGKINQR